MSDHRYTPDLADPVVAAMVGESDGELYLDLVVDGEALSFRMPLQLATNLMHAMGGAIGTAEMRAIIESNPANPVPDRYRAGHVDHVDDRPPVREFLHLGHPMNPKSLNRG